MRKQNNFTDKCFKNKDGRIVLWQNPNLPLWVWLATAILANIFMIGKPHRLFDSVAFGALFTWAYLEAKTGVNYFRRGLGLVVLVMIVANRV